MQCWWISIIWGGAWTRVEQQEVLNMLLCLHIIEPQHCASTSLSHNTVPPHHWATTSSHRGCCSCCALTEHQDPSETGRTQQCIAWFVYLLLVKPTVVPVSTASSCYIHIMLLSPRMNLTRLLSLKMCIELRRSHLISLLHLVVSEHRQPEMSQSIPATAGCPSTAPLLWTAPQGQV